LKTVICEKIIIMSGTAEKVKALRFLKIVLDFILPCRPPSATACWLGEVRNRSFEQQHYRASCLNLVTTAIVVLNTGHLSRR